MPAPTTRPATTPDDFVSTTARPRLAPSMTPTDPPRLTDPVATPSSRPTPSLVPALVFQNGNLDLIAPYRLEYVQFNLVFYRDIEVIRGEYGLGPAGLA
jgi:hypothetical protein